MEAFPLRSEKEALRVRARENRVRLKAEAPDAAPAIARNFLSAIAVQPRMYVAGYSPSRDEADLKPLLALLWAQGAHVLLPRVAAKAQPLMFHLWNGEALVPGAYGIPEPAAHFPLGVPDILLVPLLAFDAKGYRLGYGGGYYDRTLAELRVRKAILAVGIAFAGQEVDRVPHDENDGVLDCVVTEAGFQKFAAG